MSDKRIGRSLVSKKCSLNSDSTSINSSKSNKVIQVQNIHSSKLTDYLYSLNQNQISSKEELPSTNSFPEMEEKLLDDKCKKDPFFKAKIDYIRSKASKDTKPKKVGPLFQQLDFDCFKDQNFTTLKQEKEISNKITQISIREMFGNRHRPYK